MCSSQQLPALLQPMPTNQEKAVRKCCHAAVSSVHNVIYKSLREQLIGLVQKRQINTQELSYVWRKNSAEFHENNSSPTVKHGGGRGAFHISQQFCNQAS